ncbi:hypothetical protein AO366_1547 [Moraxella catarrhalis]|nr:hypothetical protein AO366_1547 [Moraxella catarrhalis]
MYCFTIYFDCEAFFGWWLAASSGSLNGTVNVVPASSTVGLPLTVGASVSTV